MHEARDITQDVFDSAEALALSLHHQAGIEDALRLVLDGPPAPAADHRRTVLGLVEALRLVRGQTEAEVARLYAVSTGRDAA
jgi:hypothetical protein